MYTELGSRYNLAYLGPSFWEVEYFKAASALDSAAALIEICLLKKNRVKLSWLQISQA
jgi:hypothetical protein